MTTTEWAYAYCREVTRKEAANFYYGIRLLPRDRRAALCAIYALARRIDDIGDGAAAAAEKHRRLEWERERLESIGGAYDDPVLVALRDASERFPIPLDVFGDLIDGVAMDVRGTSYETFAELLPYCRRVAGSIGRLSLGVFDASDRDAASVHADDLGVAFQLTNILRDVREDLGRGRVYLPAEDLDQFGCRLELDLGSHEASGRGSSRGKPRFPFERSGGPALPAACGHDESGPLAALIRFEADRAAAWFEAGLRLLPLLDRQSAACVGAMAGIYRRLLGRIERRPELVLRGRVSVPTWEKGWVAVRSLTTTA